MDNYIYTVEIPAILNLLLNYETREFKDSNPGIAREKALIYLSDIIKKAIETEIITINFFTDNNSLELKKIEKKEDLPCLENTQILDFEKISEYSIQYSYNDYIMWDAYRIRNNGQEILENYGFLRIMLSSSKYSIKECILDFKNTDYQSINLERKILKDFLDYNNLELLPVISKNNFFNQIKKRELKQLFYDKENLYQKEILVTENFNDIEKIYLSFLNSFYLNKYLFIPKKNSGFKIRVLKILEKAYDSENKLKHYDSLEIDAINYEVFCYENYYAEELIYSKQGKLYIRNNKGLTEVDEQTTLTEIFEIKYINPELQEIINII